MKNLFFIGLILVWIFSGCNTIDTEIQRSEVTVDTVTHIWTYNKNGKKVTGTVISELTMGIMPLVQKRKIKDGLSQRLLQYYTDGKLYFEVGCVDGMAEGEGKAYYPSGKIRWIDFYKEDKRDSLFRWYYEDGRIWTEGTYKNGLQDGVFKFYDIYGKQNLEEVYERGEKIKSYDFDNDGKKIIPAIERLKLVACSTGFYESFGVYEPTIIMKWQNISDEPLKKVIEIQVAFEVDGEDWGSGWCYLQSNTELPLRPGVTRQVYTNSKRGWSSAYWIGKKDVWSQIFVDKKLFKTLKIENRVLTSTLIQ